MVRAVTSLLQKEALGRGIPYPPPLFFLYGEGLAHNIQQAINNKAISGIKISRNGPVINHLFFADDSIIFTEAAHSSVMRLKRLLQAYDEKSVQLINFTKSAVLFSRNTEQSQRQYLSTLLQVQNINSESTYMGLPPFILRSKKESFEAIIKKIQQALAIVSAIPIYSMMFFKLPLLLSKRINSLMARFWWGRDISQKGINWIAWNRMTKSKWEGGLDFKDFTFFNQALLAKQGWRILNNKDSLLSQVLKGRYFCNKSIWEAKKTSSSSWGWQSLLYGLILLKKGIRWQISSGRETKTMEDPWIPRGYPLTPHLQEGIEKSHVPPLVQGLMIH
ncbi:uncharacterized protein LOC126672691 [Mercurialis annua]|uniref:uncharacterized protein LOC126672691 n=1 Tax=Mercurialis annua TaxID=3986 RepID=UPI002160999E|nr:uncharacterized protein LOC126672691 [Mercurialis annua]